MEQQKDLHDDIIVSIDNSKQNNDQEKLNRSSETKSHNFNNSIDNDMSQINNNSNNQRKNSIDEESNINKIEENGRMKDNNNQENIFQSNTNSNSNQKQQFNSFSNSASSSNKKTAIAYECSICLEVAKEPVVTKCGHLFCWPCIYSWNEQRKTCPNCNNPINNTDFVPIYNKDQNNENTKRFKIPERPKGERNPNTENTSGNAGRNFFNNMNFGFGFFGLPFFGMSFNIGGNNNGGTSPTNTNNHFNANDFLGLNNINLFPGNENLNKATKHLITIIIILVFYYILYN